MIQREFKSGSRGLNNQEEAKKIIDPKQMSYAQNLLYRQGSLISKWFPDAQSREAQKYQAELMKLEGETALELRKKSAEFQKLALRDAINAVLRKGGISVKADTQEFTARIATQLEMTLADCQREFDSLVDVIENELPKIKSERLKARKEKYLNGRIDDYYEMMETFATEFKSQIANQIS